MAGTHGNQYAAAGKAIGGKAKVSPWLLGSLGTAAVVFFTTFQSLISVPVVSSYIGGNIFGIATYVRGLATQYSPWLDKMMNASTGAKTAKLLTYGSVGLTVLEVVAMVALVALLLHFVLAFTNKRRLSRAFGLTGFVLALAIPLVMIAVVRFVAWQMTNSLVAIDVLTLTYAPIVQLAAAVLGGVFVVLATRGGRETKKA
ncbi:MAG: hypothetical protein AB2L09_05725 [Coriobacteriia bacterium]